MRRVKGEERMMYHTKDIKVVKYIGIV